MRRGGGRHGGVIAAVGLWLWWGWCSCCRRESEFGQRAVEFAAEQHVVRHGQQLLQRHNRFRARLGRSQERVPAARTRRIAACSSGGRSGGSGGGMRASFLRLQQPVLLLLCLVLLVVVTASLGGGGGGSVGNDEHFPLGLVVLLLLVDLDASEHGMRMRVALFLRRFRMHLLNNINSVAAGPGCAQRRRRRRRRSTFAL